MSSKARHERALRGAVLGTVVWMLTLLGHTAGGGALPALAGGTVAVALAFALGMAVAGRRRGLPTLVALLLVGQGLMHLVLSVTTHAHADTSWAMLTGHLVAAAVAAVVIDRGEQTVSRWVAYLAQAIGGAPVVLQEPERPTLAVASSVRADRYHASIVHHVVRRGPPVHRTPIR